MADIKFKIRPRGGIDPIFKLPLKSNNGNESNISKNTFVNLYSKYLEDKKNGKVRFYGTITFLSPLAGKNKVPQTLEDLFQTVENGLQITDLNIYFGKRISLDNLGDNKYKEKIIVYDKNKFVDGFKLKISKDIFGNDIYNFVINSDHNSSDLHYIIIDFNEYLPNTIIDGDIVDSNNNIVEEELKNYPLTIDGVIYDYFYNNKVKLVYDDNQPLINNNHYSYNKILFKLLPDFNNESMENLYESYINEEILISNTPNNINNTCN